MTDDLERRLRAADPMNSSDAYDAPPSWIPDVVEATMTEQINPQRRRWQIPAAAAAVLVLGAGSYAVAQSRDDSGHQPTQASPRPMKLGIAAPAPGMGSCIRFSVDILAKMPVAFSATVLKTTDHSVLLGVDHWYRGGAAQQVEISWRGPSGLHPNGTFTEDGVSLAVGQRYLVTATHGVVNGCGYTTRWNAPTAAMFEAAFT